MSDASTQPQPATATPDLSGVHLWLVLWKAYRAVEARDRESIRRLGFACLSDFGVLEVLLHKGPQTVSAIGAAVDLTSGSATSAVKRAEAKGYVRRVPSPEDGRSVLIGLTPTGRKVIRKAFDQHAAYLESVFDGLDPDERAALLRLLKKAGRGAAGSA
ncbi:MAG: MarR family winged helix-turn-helix transcriptional regulator [Opitutales bacterium]